MYIVAARFVASIALVFAMSGLAFGQALDKSTQPVDGIDDIASDQSSVSAFPLHRIYRTFALKVLDGINGLNDGGVPDTHDVSVDALYKFKIGDAETWQLVPEVSAAAKNVANSGSGSNERSYEETLSATLVHNSDVAGRMLKISAGLGGVHGNPMHADVWTLSVQGRAAYSFCKDCGRLSNLEPRVTYTFKDPTGVAIATNRFDFANLFQLDYRNYTSSDDPDQGWARRVSLVPVFSVLQKNDSNWTEMIGSDLIFDFTLRLTGGVQFRYGLDSMHPISLTIYLEFHRKGEAK